MRAVPQTVFYGVMRSIHATQVDQKDRTITLSSVALQNLLDGLGKRMARPGKIRTKIYRNRGMCCSRRS